MPQSDPIQGFTGLPLYPETYAIPDTLAALYNFLLARSNMVFDTATARDAALPSPTDGMECYVTADKCAYVRSGGQWLVTFKDTGWLNLTNLASGWSAAGGTPQVRQVGDDVKFRGNLVNSGFTGGYTTVATLPAAITVPSSATRQAAIGGNTTIARSVAYTTSGQVQMYAASASNAYYPLGPGYRV